jgi:hypothetical protein
MSHQEKRQAQTTAFQNAGFASPEHDGNLFDHDFEKALGYHLGAQFYNCIDQVRQLVPQLIALNATNYDTKIDRNGTDGRIWLEKNEKDLIIMGFENQNVTYLVYIITKHGDDEIHVRQLWADYYKTVKSGNYMLGKPDWDSLESPSYADVILKSKTALSEYSDDMRNKHGKRINDSHFIQRPSLTTHQDGLKNAGMKLKDGRDAGYIASVTLNTLTEAPYCDSPTKAMQTTLSYIFMDFKSVLNYPCLGGEE